MPDPICKTPSLDPSIFASVTSQYFDINEFRPFLCEVMKMAGIDNIDPILFFPEPIDYSATVLNFAALTGVGDPRISLGHVLSAGFNEFFPLALAQVEVIRSGGCQVIDGFICDSDGNQKKTMTVYCPPNFTTSPITAPQIIKRAKEIIFQGMNDHAQRFSDYITSLRADGWTDSLFYYPDYPTFYIKLVKENSKHIPITTLYKYLKYYPDSRKYVSESLDKPIVERLDNKFDSQEHYDAVVAIIPRY